MAEFIEPAPEFFTRNDGIRIAYRHIKGDGPTLIFLPGYMSDMQGGKAQAVAQWAADNGRDMLRLDYSGCGESDGEFADGTLSLWRDDVLAVMDSLSINGDVQLIGSSMGGWLMLMLAQKLGPRVNAIIGIAAAPDFTDWGFSDADKQIIRNDGVLYEDNPYGPNPTPNYRGFWEDGEAHKMLTGILPINCPVRLLHGQNDTDVPWNISMQLAEKLRSSDVQIILIKDGDHRLSHASDIDLLINIIARLP